MGKTQQQISTHFFSVPKLLQGCSCLILRCALSLNGENDSCRSGKFHFNSSSNCNFQDEIKQSFEKKNERKLELRAPWMKTGEKKVYPKLGRKFAVRSACRRLSLYAPSRGITVQALQSYCAQESH